MIAVIFEVEPYPNKTSSYFNMAADLKSELEKIDGFVSVERFESVTQPGKFLSLSFWRDEEAIRNWRNVEKHRHAQAVGRSVMFENYRLRIASVVRDYGKSERNEAPADSREAHEAG